MKRLKQVCMAVVLTLLLSVLAIAGDIQIGAPSPPPNSATSSATNPGDIQIPGEIEIPGAPSDPITEVALNLLQTVLSIF